MQRFSDAVVVYGLGFLAVIFNIKIVQRMQLCPQTAASDESCSLLSQNKFSAIFADVFSENAGVLKISFVSYIKDRVVIGPEPNSKSPARLTTLLRDILTYLIRYP